jgi:5'-nucleotidase/UDP-sugar diphosphatase
VRNDFSVGRRVARGLAPTPYANKFSNRLTVTAGEPAGAVILLSKRKALWLCCCICGVLLAVGADRSPTRRLLILHTNDIHDHVRAGENGIGGLAFIAGAVRQIRQERGGVLVLDAGDATEKGDLVAARTDGMITFEAMRFVGYDGVTLGNHDLVGNPRELLAKYESALGQRFLCANLLGSDGLAVFESSRLIEVNGIRVGVVGLTLAAREGGKQLGVLDLKRSGAELRRQALLLREKGADLVVALCHEGSRDCAELAAAAPEVAVFVSGHTHEVLQAPIIVPATGAIVVQAGCYARWLGWLELEVDAQGRVLTHRGKLIPLRHAEFAANDAVVELVSEREKELASEAARPLMRNLSPIGEGAVGQLAAEAVRRASGADIAFCTPSQLVRDGLSAGMLDYNSVYKSVGLLGRNVIEVEMSGAEIAGYFSAMQTLQNEMPEWAGFRVRRVEGVPKPQLVPEISASRRYRVALPLREWEQRVMRLARAKRDVPGDALGAMARTPPLRLTKLGLSVPEALFVFLRQETAGRSAQAFLAELTQQREAPISATSR